MGINPKRISQGDDSKQQMPKHEEGTFSVEGRVPPPLIILQDLDCPMLMATMPGWIETWVPGAKLNKLLMGK
jgi:hypothetical protein